MERINNNNLTVGKVWLVLLKFALPVFLGTLFQSLYTTVDAIIVGQFAGKEALASIESVYTVTGLPMKFFIGISTGAMILISQFYGAKKNKEISDLSHTVILFSFLGSIFLTLLAFVLCDPLLHLIQVPKEIFEYARIYVLIYFSGIMASLSYNVGAGILRALGNSKLPFYLLVMANIINIIFDLLFVAYFDLGVTGAALATVLAQIVCAICMLFALYKTDLPCKISFKKLKIHKEHFMNFMKLGLPIGVQASLFPISNMIVQTSINSFGVNAISAWAVCGKVDFLVWYFSEAICMAVSTFVAQNYGARLFNRSKEGLRAGLLMGVISVGFVSGILYIFRNNIGSLIVQDQDVIELVGQILSFLCPLYVLYVFVEVLPGAIRGMGETFKPMMISLFGTCLFRIVWVFFILPLNPSFFMVLYCYPASWLITSLAFFIFYFVLSKKKLSGHVESGF